MNSVGLFNIAASVVALATISVALINGEKTAKVIGAGANGFANVIRAATLQKSK